MVNTSPVPAVSIVIATYNRSPVLRLALESVRRQIFTDWEALVIGDGCTDGSGEIVESMGDPRFRWVNLERNTGSQSAPNSLGLAMARGRWVAYLGHDDLWFPWHLLRLVQTIETEGADFVHPLMAYFTESGLAGCWGVPPEGVGYAELQIPTSGWLHRRELAAEVGGWADPDSIDLFVDFHLMRRMALSGALFAYTPKLCLLKFPSWHFPGGYRNEQVPLQATLLRSMILDSKALELEILEKSANMLAQLQREADHRYLAQFLLGAGSPDSVQRFQELRHAVRERRGLADNVGEQLGAPPVISAIIRESSAAAPPTDSNREGTIALSIRCSGATPDTFALLDGVPLPTSVESADLVTAVVPQDLMAHRGTRSLVLINRAGTSRSAPFVIP